jgi:hypothetical protein
MKSGISRSADEIHVSPTIAFAGLDLVVGGKKRERGGSN